MSNTMLDTDANTNGWGGKRKGAGRPKKPPVTPSNRRNTPCGPVVPIMVKMPNGRASPGITTSGALDQFERAWVYVGVRKADGLVKIGMSGNVPQRCRQLRISLFFAHPVVPGLAKTLESMALRKLGVVRCGSEWVACKPESAAEAVMAARNDLSLICHADPDESPLEAYNRRKGY